MSNHGFPRRQEKRSREEPRRIASQPEGAPNMAKLKADYRSIAAFYDKGRSLSDKNTALWLDLISRLSGVPKAARVLDLGCGTGRFSLPMAERLGWDVTGADASPQMLARAKQKDSASRVSWVLVDAGAREMAHGCRVSGCQLPRDSPADLSDRTSPPRGRSRQKHVGPEHDTGGVLSNGHTPPCRPHR